MDPLRLLFLALLGLARGVEIEFDDEYEEEEEEELKPPPSRQKPSASSGAIKPTKTAQGVCSIGFQTALKSI